MAAIIDYYEKLGLNPEMTIGEIGSKLDELEAVCYQRLLSDPEKANNLLALIGEAREHFATADAKAAYDAALQNTEEDLTQKETTAEAIDVLMRKVFVFADNGQWDLAKVSIDKVLGMLDSDDISEEQEAFIYRYAGNIYTKNGIYQQAVDLENRALVINPDDFNGYLCKAGTLDALIVEMQGTGQDPTKFIEMLKKTCESLIGTAMAKQDPKMASLGLEWLALAYVRAGDFPSAYRYSAEAYAVDPKKQAGTGILEFLSKPSSTDENELKRYYNEKSPIEEEIVKLIAQLVHYNLIPKNGLKLVEKKSHRTEEEDFVKNREDENYTFILNQDGTFVKKNVHTETILNYNDGRTYTNDQNTFISACDLQEIMCETDFSIYGTGENRQHGIFVYSQVVRDVGGLTEFTLTRHNRIKGLVLYEMLKKRVDKAALLIRKQDQYNEECQRINAAYNAELEPLKAKIMSEFTAKRTALRGEKHAAIENAKKQEPQRISIQNEIDAMKKELSSLGLFAGKKKREIQANIKNLEQYLSGLGTVESVSELYSQKAIELQQQEREAVEQLEKELRAKYPLPSLE